jgi:hypothetical protein
MLSTLLLDGTNDIAGVRYNGGLTKILALQKSAI